MCVVTVAKLQQDKCCFRGRGLAQSIGTKNIEIGLLVIRGRTFDVIITKPVANHRLLALG